MDETIAINHTCPVSSLRFVPPFAPTHPTHSHHEPSNADLMLSRGHGQGQYNSMGEPTSLQQQQQQQQPQYYNHDHHAINVKLNASSVDLNDAPSQRGSYIFDHSQGGPSVVHNSPHPQIIYPHDDHKLALVLSTPAVDWNCPHIVTFVLEYLLGDNLLQLQGQGSHLSSNQQSGKGVKGSKARGGGRGKRTVDPLSIREVRFISFS